MTFFDSGKKTDKPDLPEGLDNSDNSCLRNNLKNEISANDQIIILASASPRRAELLKKIVADFVVIPSDFDESNRAGSPYEYAAACARGKALDIYNKCTGNSEGFGLADIQSNNRSIAVIGADTVVFAGGKILGKPVNRADAVEMLNLISGKEHTVITSICIVSDGEVTETCAETKLFFDKLTDREIEEYIATNSPFDKAGAYGIQDELVGKKLKYITGSFDNVVGLPTELLDDLMPRVLSKSIKKD